MVYDQLKELIASQLDVDEKNLTLETNLKEDLDADSLDLVELCLQIEDKFEIGFVEDEDLENIKTIGDMVDFIEDRINK